MTLSNYSGSESSAGRVGALGRVAKRTETKRRILGLRSLDFDMLCYSIGARSDKRLSGYQLTVNMDRL